MSSYGESQNDAAGTGLEAAIASQDDRWLEQHFLKKGMSRPKFQWRPTEQQAPTAELRALLTYWMSLRDGNRLPRQSDFDALSVPSVLGFIMLIDVLNNGEDFYYRVYGTWIARGTGFDLTGKRVSSMPTAACHAAYFMACYRAVVNKRLPLLAYDQPLPGDPIRQWARLILPLVNQDDSVSRLLVGNIPDTLGKFA